MRKTMRKICICLVAVMLLSTANVTAMGSPNMDSEIVPHYDVIKSIRSNLEINRSGKATCSASVRTSSVDYTINVTCTLYKSDGSVVKSWSTTGKGTVSMEKNWYVTSGSSYQVEASATVYDSTGNYVDSDNAYSEIVYY